MDADTASRGRDWGALELTGRSRAHVVELAAPPCLLHREVVAPWLALRAAAARAGIDLIPGSSFRDFEHQRRIWNAKFHGERALLGADGRPLDAGGLDAAGRVDAILHWSAVPGASRHHWGTEIDVLDGAALSPGQRPRLLPAEYAPGGVFERLGAWLDEQAGDFGFYRPYDVYRGGVQPEPWHLSYAPVAREAQRLLTLDLLAATLAGADVAGRDTLLARLDEIHTRYVQAVAEPSGRELLAAQPITPAASSS
ncbi:MAG: M15 family metallopeptidase [Gammaproteobacteria bacterium]|nr:M15 family metallopeptidase [Gammaproteobacteria bacterium]